MMRTARKNRTQNSGLIRLLSCALLAALLWGTSACALAGTFDLPPAVTVGDAAFQAKCRARIAEIIADGATVFFVSHSLPDIVQLCSRAIWLKKGRVVMDGPAAEVADAYHHDAVPGPDDRESLNLPLPVHRFRAPAHGDECLTIDEGERNSILHWFTATRISQRLICSSLWNSVSVLYSCSSVS